MSVESAEERTHFMALSRRLNHSLPSLLNNKQRFTREGEEFDA